MENNTGIEVEEMQDDEDDEVEVEVSAFYRPHGPLAPNRQIEEVVHRKRKVSYVTFSTDKGGLDELVKLVGEKRIVDNFMKSYRARNTLLSSLDRFDGVKGKEWKGDPLPEKDSDVTLYLDLTKVIPTGTRRTKWGNLKNFIGQAEELLKKGGHATTEENIRKVAGKLLEQHEKMKADALNEALGL
jgi:hypothetical protein